MNSKNFPKISVIIPVYNVEKYLHECLNSVLQQTFTDFEVLLINDGSTDSSGEICDEYAKKDNRIKVFHKINGGVSTARNHGIKESQGMWVCFIDSDDTVNNHYLQDFVSGVKSNSCDFVVQGFINRLNGKQNDSNKVILKNEFVNQFHLYPLGPVCKFFSNNILKEKKVTFSVDLSYGEDTLFVLDYLIHCNLVLYLYGNNYHYNKVPNSLSTKVLGFDRAFFLATKLLYRLKKMDLRIHIISTNLRYPLGKLLRSVFTNCDEKEKRVENLKTIFFEFRENYLLIFKTSGFKGKVFYTLLKYRKVRLIELIYRKLYKYA
ncbi:glycosyltransferase family 2 protein [Epilithonimonas sp.]|uniref:glycosyltransferase family 2 protein n=1 Tax=Epilithonimonas sp. TaxID=2894511 RepID=UPI002897F6AD|nr:glycosyltransferase family 2 protein [Epilithonimonas sp.]